MDKITGSKAERKGLNEALAYVRPGDTFMVWKLDRAGRSLKLLIELLKDLQGRGIEFVSLTEQIDTTTPGGKLIFHLMGALAEFERDLIRERTNAGLAAARARSFFICSGPHRAPAPPLAHHSSTMTTIKNQLDPFYHPLPFEPLQRSTIPTALSFTTTYSSAR
ncbi:hypothetical protein KSF_000650 [Reticulibacter mediterranei]|uniref:Resolvase/invertase-type recombinase catalytic domain-containing protein n=1 Tax=Reticulibacter mediterranei TaxID=2778369 RepID=A0A8J3N097_9CHLR|nr:hypothetical protein KSF_000650 [Reticulibacter mediterranei]